MHVMIWLLLLMSNFCLLITYKFKMTKTVLMLDVSFVANSHHFDGYKTDSSKLAFMDLNHGFHFPIKKKQHR